MKSGHLETKLSPSPVSALGVVSDLVISPQANPLWERSVNPLLLGQDLLDPKGLLRRLRKGERKERKNKAC